MLIEGLVGGELSSLVSPLDPRDMLHPSNVSYGRFSMFRRQIGDAKSLKKIAVESFCR